MKTQDEKPSWLQHFPIMFYTVVMGLVDWLSHTSG